MKADRKSLKWQDRALLALSALLLLLLIFRIETATAQQDLWGLEFQDDGGSRRSLALNTEMQVNVTGLVARVKVAQVFHNSGRGWSEAIYRFPLPDGSAVDRMTVQVGTRVLVGEIQENHDARRQYQQAKSNGKIATLIEQQRANQFETRLANIGPDFGDTPQSTLMTFDDGDAVYAMLMLVPPLAEAISPQPREVVFIIDTSGSMEGISLTQAKAALRLGLDYLGKHDRFNLIHFNSHSHQLFPQSMPVYSNYLLQAETFIDGLGANGGTDMAPALDMAFNLPPQAGLLRQLVFITDGSVGNEGELLLQIGEELDDSRLFTVSIGSAPNSWFMRKAAEIGRGNHTRIGKLSEVEESMSRLWLRIQTPAIKNIRVDWRMNADFYPEIVPDLYAGEPLWLYARLPFQPVDVTVHGELEGQPWEQVSRILPGAGSENLATLWARSKIEALEDSRIFGEDPDFIRAVVTGLALDFGLLTPYTSMIAVDKTPSRAQGKTLDSEEIPNLLPAGSPAVSTGFSQTATGWVAQLIFSFITLLAAAGMLLLSPPPRKERPGSASSPMATSVKGARFSRI